MASSIQSNPVYYSLASLSSGQSTSTRTVVLHKRPDHDGFGVFIGEDIPSGLYIVTVERNSPASDASVQPGDRVLAINGQLVSTVVKNPKELLINAAANAQTLTLTIQTTDIFQTLNIPLANSNKENNNNTHQQYNRKHHSSGQTLNNSMDLEGYIKSLFANEDVEILRAPTNNEFILKSDRYPKSTSNFSSLPNRSHHSSAQRRGYDSQKHHHHHHHHRHRQPKRTSLQTIATQTSLDNDQDENTPQERPTTPPSRQHSAHPSMGKPQLILRTQQQIAADNAARESQKSKPLPANNNLEFTGISPSSDSNDESSSAMPDRGTQNSSKNDPPISRMVDVVTAAMSAAKKGGQSNNREQTVPRESNSTSKGSTTAQTSRETVSATSGATAPPPSRDSVSTPRQESTAPSSRGQVSAPRQESTAPSSRGQVSAPRQESTVPPSRPSENLPRESTPAPKQNITPPQNESSPPPYTPTASSYTSPNPVDNRDSANEGSYNIPRAEANQRTTSTDRSGNAREVRLRRLPDFQGFGFHLQYNKTYYLVQRIEANSPAEQGGLNANDVILSINQENTASMPHVTFVQIVNSNSEVTFLVQPLEEYLRVNPPPPRTQRAAPIATASASNDQEKQKNGLSRALSKLTSR